MMTCCIVWKTISLLLFVIPFICQFFFLSSKTFYQILAAPVRARVFKFCKHLESGQVYCGKENQDAEIYFCLLFPVFHFSIFHSNVIHREICVKDFSRTTVHRILQFDTTVVWKRISIHLLIIPFICLFFYLIQIFVTDFWPPMRATVFKFCIYRVSQKNCAPFHMCSDVSIFFANFNNWALSSEFVSSSIPSWQI